MKNNKTNWNRLLGLLPIITLVIVLVYHYAYFFAVPYFGFRFHTKDWEVLLVLSPDEIGDKLSVGDKIVSINGLSREEFKKHPSQGFPTDFIPGEDITLEVIRAGDTRGEITSVNIPYQGYSRNELRERLNSTWWMALFFWMTGTAAFLLVRPRDLRWRLFVAYNYLTAVWVIAGGRPANFHLFGALLVTRAAIWLSVPIAVHLHFDFPKPFAKIPRNIVRLGLSLLYILSLSLAAMEIIFPQMSSYYASGFALSLLISLTLLVAHYILQKDTRTDLKFIFWLSILAFVPILIISMAGNYIELAWWVAGGSIISLPLLPIAYFWAIFRRRLGNSELRVNRGISIYLYVVTLLTLLVVSIGVIQLITGVPVEAPLTTIFVAIIVTILTLATFNKFERFVEYRVLGIPHTPDQLIEEFSNQITSSISLHDLSKVLTDKVLKSLLIQESGLILIERGEPSVWIYNQGFNMPAVPAENEMAALIDLCGHVLSLEERQSLPTDLQWVRLGLLLKFDAQPIALWLMGQHDPDDFYSLREIETLQVLANQTAIALMNNRHATHLRSLYQINIDLHESERARLARELHDETLNSLGLIKQRYNAEGLNAEIDEVISNLRKIIRGLRPEMLAFGLITALEDLADTLNERQQDTEVVVDLKGDIKPIDPNVELHIFRIIQQACDNALAHANSPTLWISGDVTPASISLKVIDRGRGFSEWSDSEISKLLANKQFGLAGMHERAILINAELIIQSQEEQGTEVQLEWQADPKTLKS